MKLFIAILVSFIIISACTKEKQTFNAVGFWKGKWSNSGPSTPPDNQYLWLLIRSDGTLRIYYDATDTTGSNKESGTYTISNDSILNWSIPDWGEMATVKIRNNSTKLVGTWGSSPSNNNLGQIEVDKQ
ncbi:MAG: hypothetical protein R2807_00990 [Chitinophagales bacterium]